MKAPSKPTGSAPVDPARCPLCGRENDCQRRPVVGAASRCWCESVSLPAGLLERVPLEAKDRACVCRNCVESFQRSLPQPPSAPGKVCLALVLILSLASDSAQAAAWSEDFSSDPGQRGWTASQNPDLFVWDASAQRLNVTWDTAHRHSFFGRPLGMTLTRQDDFSFRCDLELSEARGGVGEGRPGAMQVAVGFINWAEATSQNYRRGAGQAKNTIEFNWFPAGFIPGYGEVEPTLSLVTFDSTARVRAKFEFPLDWPPSNRWTIEVSHRAAERTLTVAVEREGVASLTLPLILDEAFGDFAVDAFAVLVWDETTSFGDSLRATGWLDNVEVILPEPSIGAIRWVTALLPTVEFASQWGWRYSLEASNDLQIWSPVETFFPGTGTTMRLTDTREALFPNQFYRVRAEPE